MKSLSLIILLTLINLIAVAQDTSKVKRAEPIVDFADVEPEFPGGEAEMVKFIQTNVVYPETSREMGEQGTVYVQFVVNADGSISDVVVLKGVSELLDAEAVRLIKLMPNWTPGMQNGTPVCNPNPKLKRLVFDLR
jgi:TonB family protein